MQLLYLSPVPWSSFSQRPHKFVEWYHTVRGKDVLWVDPYPTRFPLLADFRRLGPQEQNDDQHIPSWLKVIRPKALPIEPLPTSGCLNALLWHSLIKEIVSFSRLESTLLTIGKPSVLALIILKQLKGITSLYDAMDDFPAFYSGISRMAMKWRERQVVCNMTHVLASSTALKQRLSRIRSDVQLVPNGLDASVLPEPKKRNPTCEHLVLGYVGTIGPWFDWDWVIALAETRASDVVRLIGPAFVQVPRGILPDNVEILPACNHADALQSMQDFHVGLIPFKKNDLTKSVDPIKYYEYRAVGLPVVSTDFGEMAFRDREEGIFLSRSRTDSNQLIQKALLYKADREITRQFIQRNTWEARFTGADIF